MEIRHFFTFNKIVEVQSFTKAAEILGYSQPTVTAHIHALERHLGLKLFDRIGRKIVLTTAGQQLVAYANQLTRIYTQIEDMAKDQASASGQLRVGAPETLTIYRLEPILKEYRETHPQIEIRLVNDGNAPLFEKLAAGEIDIAFQIASAAVYKDYVSVPLAEESFVLVAGPGCDITGLVSDPADITDQTVIYNAKGCIYRTIFENYLQAKQLVPRHIIELWSIEAIKRGVMAGLGIALLPSVTVKQELAEGRLQAVALPLPAVKIATELIYHKNKWLSKAMLAWIDLALKQAKSWA